MHPVLKKADPNLGSKNGPVFGPANAAYPTAVASATQKQRRQVTMPCGISGQAKHTGEERGLEANFCVRNGSFFWAANLLLTKQIHEGLITRSLTSGTGRHGDPKIYREPEADLELADERAWASR